MTIAEPFPTTLCHYGAAGSPSFCSLQHGADIYADQRSLTVRENSKHTTFATPQRSGSPTSRADARGEGRRRGHGGRDGQSAVRCQLALFGEGGLLGHFWQRAEVSARCFGLLRRARGRDRLCDAQLRSSHTSPESLDTAICSLFLQSPTTGWLGPRRRSQHPRPTRR